MSDTKNTFIQGELPSDTLIEIHDPEIDPALLIAEIRSRIQKRRAELGYIPQQFVTFGGTRFPGRPDDVPYDPDYYDHLEMANEFYPDVETDVDLRPSPATRIPIIGRFWSLVREQAHQLVLFYVNRALSHQMGVNREIVNVLNKEESIILRQQRTIFSLQNELYLLRQQLNELQK